MSLDDAACRGMPQHYFYLNGQDPAYSEHLKIALSICAGCPVISECRAAARKYEKNQPRALRFGIWGGLTPLQRFVEDRNLEKK